MFFCGHSFEREMTFRGPSLQANSKLYLNLLELEFCADLKENEENVLNCFEQALTSDLSVDLKITFSQRKVEFLEDFGSDMKT